MSELIEVVYTADRLEVLFDKILDHFEGESIKKDDLKEIFDRSVLQLRELNKEKLSDYNNKYREIRSKKDKIEVDELPESPEDCKFCLGELRRGLGLYECCFVDPDCPTPHSKMVCSLSKYGFCNMLKLRKDQE